MSEKYGSGPMTEPGLLAEVAAHNRGRRAHLIVIDRGNTGTDQTVSYGGKDVNLMTREELIDAMKVLSDMLDRNIITAKVGGHLPP